MRPVDAHRVTAAVVEPGDELGHRDAGKHHPDRGHDGATPEPIAMDRQHVPGQQRHHDCDRQQVPPLRAEPAAGGQDDGQPPGDAHVADRYHHDHDPFAAGAHPQCEQAQPDDQQLPQADARRWHGGVEPAEVADL